MDELENLYQEIILDHGKNPRNFNISNNCMFSAVGKNPFCGDNINICVNINKIKEIEKVTFSGTGCAISIASASLMTEIVSGKKIEEAMRHMKNFIEMITRDDCENKNKDSLGKLNALLGVKQFPMRVKCATLAWHAFSAAIKNKKQVSTE